MVILKAVTDTKTQVSHLFMFITDAAMQMI